MVQCAPLLINEDSLDLSLIPLPNFLTVTMINLVTILVTHLGYFELH